ncbi:MAG: hypothetical protein COT74_01945 [Bdellovibrionales bacterium CG10_big_fil_rev_8_21_14_0_10_45_34]|nr:MAG: hypothetical protein COT74_01945 [Bdellovibrionales bacterium CG10_big_fil_rev_8_21_14_0_10_45_34]
MERLNKAFATEMILKGMKTNILSDKTGISATRLDAILELRTRPRKTEKILIAEALEVSANELFCSPRHDHSDRAGATVITARSGQKVRIWKCGGAYRPCKRLECEGCEDRRKSYFVEAATLLALSRGMIFHCTISLIGDPSDAWYRLLTLSSGLSKYLTGKIGPFIRCLSVDPESSTPHVHYLIPGDKLQIFQRLCKKYLPPEQRVFVARSVAYDVEGLLEYFWSNFMDAMTDPQRIKGLRLLSGTRGITYGYPRKRHYLALQEMKQEQREVFNGENP